MRAVDTNVLVRLMARDDSRQAEAAESFISRGAWVSHLVLAETLWVLDAVHGLAAPQLARAVEMLLAHEQLSVQEPDIVRAALQQFRERLSVGFSDCLLLEVARKAGHLPLGTFDRKLARAPGALRL